MTDAFGLDTSVGSSDNLNTPIALRSDLIQKAVATHTAIDSWTPPAGLQVTAIAGWGQLTTYSYTYDSEPGHTVCSVKGAIATCTRDTEFVHTPLQTEDGDGTVVVPSAAGDIGDSWYFDTQAFRSDQNPNIFHQGLLNASAIQNSLIDVLKGHSISQNYIIKNKPAAVFQPLISIGGMSPINLLAIDSQGNESGIVPLNSNGLYLVKKDIPRSSVYTSGDEKFLYLPEDERYSIKATGYDSGPANIEIKKIAANGTIVASTTIADIPTTASTTIEFSLDASGTPSDAVVDFNGDDTPETTIKTVPGSIASFASSTSPIAYIAFLEDTVSSMGLSKVPERKTLDSLRRLVTIIKDYEKRKADLTRNRRRFKTQGAILEREFSLRITLQLSMLENYIKQQERISERNPRFFSAQEGIPTEKGDQILAMLNELWTLFQLQ
jgi:hypothetical protein